MDALRQQLAAASAKLDSLDVKMQRLETAFVRNDLQTPDFDGHRKAHLKLISQEETMQGIRVNTAKNIVWSVVALIGLAIGLALKTYFKQ